MLALDSGNHSRVAHAFYMGSVAVSSIGDYDEARRRIEVVQDSAQRTGNPTDMASAWVAVGFAAEHDNDAALEAFDNADRLARSAGNRWMSGFARTEACGLLVHRGDIEEGGRGLAELVDMWFRAGEWSHQWTTLSRCVIALDRLGQPELAAQAVGAIEAHTTMGCPPVTPAIRDVVFETRDSLTAQLGEELAIRERMIGANSPLADLVNRTRSALLGRQGHF